MSSVLTAKTQLFEAYRLDPQHNLCLGDILTLRNLINFWRSGRLSQKEENPSIVIWEVLQNEDEAFISSQMQNPPGGHPFSSMEELRLRHHSSWTKRHGLYRLSLEMKSILATVANVLLSK